MSKMRKDRKGERHLSSFSPLALLRPRLDGFLSNEALTRKEYGALKADLNAVFKGLKATEFLPVLLSACRDAPLPVQERMDTVIPVWLSEQGYLQPLLELVQKRQIAEEDEERALAWLKAAGIDVARMEKARPAFQFYKAYMYSDGSQGIIMIFWYSDRRRSRVQGLGFLIDYNPPWEGAVKDVMVFPQRTLEKAQREFVDFWARRFTLISPGPAEVKLEILRALECNKHEQIRLPRDLVLARDLFVKHVLTLPDTPETPGFTLEDFVRLSRSGRPAEAIMEFEQKVGRLVRLEDGKEVLVMGADDLEDELE
jgi:hypothetical protein